LHGREIWRRGRVPSPRQRRQAGCGVLCRDEHLRAAHTIPSAPPNMRCHMPAPWHEGVAAVNETRLCAARPRALPPPFRRQWCYRRPPLKMPLARRHRPATDTAGAAQRSRLRFYETRSASPRARYAQVFRAPATQQILRKPARRSFMFLQPSSSEAAARQRSCGERHAAR